MASDFIEILRDIRGSQLTTELARDDETCIYGEIAKMYDILTGDAINYEIVADNIDAINGVYNDLDVLNSLYADKATLDSIFADKSKLDSIFTDKATLDSLYADKATLDSIFADKTALDSIAANMASILDATSEPLRQSILDAESNANTASSKATEAQLKAWEAEAERMTADSFATEPEDVFVKIWSSNGDGTFSSVNTTEYSSYHWKEKSSLAASGAAANIGYDNVSSGMAANDVQGAIDEIDTKLDGIEDGATADQTGSEIKSLYEGEADTNAYTDAEQTKLAGIEAGATADQNASEVPYDNTISDLVATDVKAALDELTEDITNKVFNQQVASSANTNPSSISISDTLSTVGASVKLHTGNGGIQDTENGIDFVTNADYSSISPDTAQNGGFDTATQWTMSGGWTIAGGIATCSPIADYKLYQNTAEVSANYAVRYDIVAYTSGSVGGLVGNNVIFSDSGIGTYVSSGNANSNVIGVQGNNFDGAIDNVEFYKLWSNGTYNTGEEELIEREGRIFRVVCLQDGVTSDPNTLFDYTDATFSDWQIDSQTNGGLAWIKERSVARDHYMYDTIRGNGNSIYSNLTDAEGAYGELSFNNNGFAVGSALATNQDGETYVSWSYQTTHIKSSLTSHGKPQIEEYNPVTGFSMIKYKGSGTAGHEIAHSQGREFGLVYHKNLDSATNWGANISDGHYMELNNTIANTAWASALSRQSDSIILNNTGDFDNSSNDLFILYGWANAIETEEGLQGNFEIGTYGGTGTVGNKITTKGEPLTVDIKRADGTGNWVRWDILRTPNSLRLNSSASEDTFDYIDIVEDGFIMQTTEVTLNASGGQYLYKVTYDNDNGSGRSKYDKPTDTSSLTFANSYFNYTARITDKGYTLTSRDVTKIVDTSGVSDGLKWVSENNDGSNSVYDTKPSWSWSEVGIAFNTDGQWYNDNVPINPTPSFMQNPVYIENGVPQYIDYSDSLEVNYMDSLNVDKLVTRNNRKILEIGTIYNNNRYVIDWQDVFTNYEGDYESYDVVIEILVEDTWIDSGYYGDGAWYGCEAYCKEEGIITVVASTGIYTPTLAGLPSHLIGSNLTSAPARIIVTYHGRAKNV